MVTDHRKRMTPVNDRRMMALTCLAAATISAALLCPLYGIVQIWIVLAVSVSTYLGYEGLRRLIVGSGAL